MLEVVRKPTLQKTRVGFFVSLQSQPNLKILIDFGVTVRIRSQDFMAPKFDEPCKKAMKPTLVFGRVGFLITSSMVSKP